jgi:DNA-binding XRE family transcriptional regulator
MGESKKTRKYGLMSDERDPRHKSSKDTKRWCRGRIGVEHRKVWADAADRFRTRFNLPYYEVLSCVECGREFDRVVKAWTVPGLIRAIRQAYGITQEELGKITGMQQSRIAAIESGENELNLKTLTRLAKAFNVSLSLDFFDCGAVRLNQQQREIAG